MPNGENINNILYNQKNLEIIPNSINKSINTIKNIAQKEISQNISQKDKVLYDKKENLNDYNNINIDNPIKTQIENKNLITSENNKNKLLSYKNEINAQLKLPFDINFIENCFQETNKQKNSKIYNTKYYSEKKFFKTPKNIPSIDTKSNTMELIKNKNNFIIKTRDSTKYKINNYINIQNKIFLINKIDPNNFEEKIDYANNNNYNHKKSPSKSQEMATQLTSSLDIKYLNTDPFKTSMNTVNNLINFNTNENFISISGNFYSSNNKFITQLIDKNFCLSNKTDDFTNYINNTINSSSENDIIFSEYLEKEKNNFLPAIRDGKEDFVREKNCNVKNLNNINFFNYENKRLKSINKDINELRSRVLEKKIKKMFKKNKINEYNL